MSRFTRSLTAVAAAAAVLGSSGTALAQHAGPPAAPAKATTLRWLKPKAMPLEHADNFTDISASGRNNIWAGGQANVEVDNGVVPIWHWNGKKWARVVAPAKVDDRVADLSTSGTGNTWLLGAVSSGLYRRSGTKWVSAGAHGDDVTAIGAVGEHGLFAAYPGGMRYYNGSTWRTYAMPANASVYAIRARSRTDVWAVGKIRTADQADQPFAAHWDGRTWTRTKMPAVGTGPQGNLLNVSDLAFVGEKDAYACGMLMTSETDYQAVLLRWNGKKWTRAAAPQAAETGLDDVAADGHGGLWAVAGGVNGVLHRSPSGSWSTYKLPGAGHPRIWAMTRIPGTKRAIGGGDVETSASTWAPAVMLTN